MQWQPSFKIGVDLLDDQHKKLFGLFNDLKAAINEKNMYQQMGITLKYIVAYTKEHFQSEEQYMKEVGYPHYEEQKALHTDLIKQVTNLILKIKKGEYLLSSQLADFLSKWLSDHILKEDLKVKLFITNQEKKVQNERLRNHKKQELLTTNALEKIVNQHNNENISDDEFIEKKNQILTKFVSFKKKADHREVKNRMRIIESFYGKELISLEEERRYKAHLFENINLSDELEKRKSKKLKLSYLESLYQNELISRKVYEEYKSTL
jgi:hemerythrin